MKIRIKDQVKILSGKDAGKTGEVERVYSKAGKVLVKGVNLYKKHLKKSEQFPKGEIIELNKPLFVAKVMLVCPKCKKATRIGWQVDKKGQKQRVCKKCSALI